MLATVCLPVPSYNRHAQTIFHIISGGSRSSVELSRACLLFNSIFVSFNSWCWVSSAYSTSIYFSFILHKKQLSFQFYLCSSLLVKAALQIADQCTFIYTYIHFNVHWSMYNHFQRRFCCRDVQQKFTFLRVVSISHACANFPTLFFTFEVIHSLSLHNLHKTGHRRIEK